MRLGELTMDAFKAYLKKKGKTLIIPFGTVEAHGTHLPLNTDTFIIREAVKKAAERTGALMAPPIQYGVCTSTSGHPGTIGITPSTLKAVSRDIVRDAFRQGLRNFVLISGHGGGIHVAAMREAGEELISELEGIRMAALSVYEIIGKEAAAIIETGNDSHAGELETSVMLYLAPGLVRGRAKEEYPRFPKPFIVRDKVKYWPGAVWGDPSKATAEKGERVFGLMVDSIGSLVTRLEKLRP